MIRPLGAVTVADVDVDCGTPGDCGSAGVKLEPKLIGSPEILDVIRA